MRFEEILKKGMQEESPDPQFIDDLASKMQTLYESCDEELLSDDKTEKNIDIRAVRTKKTAYLSIASAVAVMLIVFGSVLAANSLRNNNADEIIPVTEASASSVSLMITDQNNIITTSVSQNKTETSVASVPQTLRVSGVSESIGSVITSPVTVTNTKVTLHEVQNTSSVSASSDKRPDITGQASDIGHHWEVKTEYTADTEMKTVSGKYQLTINNPGGAANGGKNERDNIFRTGGISMKAGHRYSVSYEITADHDGYFSTVINGTDPQSNKKQEVWSNTYGKTVRITVENGNEETETWNNTLSSDNWELIYIKAGQTFKMSSVFTCDYDIDNGFWEFELGGSASGSIFNYFPEGSELIFENMKITDEGKDDTWDSENPSYTKEVSEDNDPEYNTYSPAPLFASFTNTALKPGQSSYAYISVNSEEAIHYLAMKLDYDRAALELISASSGDDSETFRITASDTGTSDLIILESNQKNAVLNSSHAIRLEFRAREDADEQKYIISLSPPDEQPSGALQYADGDDIFIPVAFSSGAVKISRD